MSQFFLNKSKNRVLFLVTLLVLSCGYAITSFAQYAMTNINEDVTALIQKVSVEKGIQSNAGAGGALISFEDPAAMQEFYTARAGNPVWVKRGDTEMAEEALALFKSSWTQGLNPKDYNLTEIQHLLDGDNTDLAKLELVVSDAAVRYGRDVSGMRINPQDVYQKQEYWRASLSAKEVLGRVSSASDPVEALAHLAPQTALYKKLQDELVRLSKDDSGYEHVLPLGFSGDHHFAPGESHKDVKGLRVRLGLGEGEGTSFYDDNTAAAVMEFQRHHGLEADGIIGPNTLAVLNRTNKDRMEQVVANLERLRWLEQDKPDRYILVNLPQQLLWAVENGRVDHEMKVVVGMAQRSTKEFKAEVTGIRFNPNWTVPLRLKMEDFVPKLVNDPTYMTNKNMEIIQGYGQNAVTLDPTSIDWQNVTRAEVNDMRFVQKPGSNNALGQIRVLMPNVYNIYMHDTNHPEFFERDQRTYSSGCVRLSEPKKIAEFILRDNKDWSNEKMEAILASGKKTEVATEKPFPVYIIYQTVWLDKSGRLVYGPDIYKRDRKLIDVLAKMDGYELPDAQNSRFANVEDGDNTSLAYNK